MSLDEPTMRLLLAAYHRGSLAEVDDSNRNAALRLIDGGYADPWRTLLGRQAIRLSEKGRMEAFRLERDGR